MSLADIVTQGQDIITHWVVQPILILLVGIFIGKVLEQVILFALQELAPKRQGYRTIAYTSAWAVYLTTIGYALASIDVLGVTLWFLFGAIITVVALSLLLGGRDFIVNFLGFRTAQKKCKEGATIRTRYGEGTVVHVMLLDTHLRTKKGDDIYIPNGTIAQLKVEKV